ncbi:MAG: superoxide dismutase family protein [Formosimonas sp.]
MKRMVFISVCFSVSSVVLGAEITVSLNMAEQQGVGASAGIVRIVETPYGLVFYPRLKGLASGLHGFHIHEKPVCAALEKGGVMVPALAAGSHLDSTGANKHGEPWGDGHLGDLPPLYVGDDGTAVEPVLGPRLTLADIRKRSLIVHAGGDNHSDHPMPLGGGGSRACKLFCVNARVQISSKAALYRQIQW